MTLSQIKYPIGIQNFSGIRKGGYIYVDKTALIFKLVNEGKYYFLARPRRFGKSLLLTTLQAYFEGRKDLFEGLHISKLQKEWQPSPVLLLSMSRYDRSSSNRLEAILDFYFQEWEKKYGIDTPSSNYSARLANVILAAYEKTGQRVAILIDEYDAPLVAHLGDNDNHNRIRDFLKSIYANLKDMDQYIRFAILTGVSRFSRTNVFSGLNNLNDITLDERYNEICGITDMELESYFKTGITQLAVKLGKDYKGALAELKANYNGYHFSENSADIYNPFSLLNALSKSKLEMFWFRTGTPTFLIETIHNTDKFLPKYFSNEVDEKMLADIDTYQKSPVALMFQTGYLTIKGFDIEERLYRLGIPNREVKEGLSQGLLLAYMDSSDIENTMHSLTQMRRAFRQGQPEEAMERIKAFLAGIPYELAKGRDEIYFENNLYLLFNLIGIRTHAEYHTSRGRIDLLLEMPDYIYIIELKLDGTPQEALAQMEEKGYAEQFATDNRVIFKIGINFSRKTRNIDSWIIN